MVYATPRIYSTILLILLALCVSCTATESAKTYSITLEERTGASIRKPELCNDDISNGGGDLVEAGERYRGKCNGAGLSPSIENDGNDRYLKFATDPDYRADSEKDRSRTELALTREWFPFGETVYIGFRLRIPEGADKTNAFFYLLQFWQCAGSPPIAGVRMTRGYSHQINFMTRGDSRAASMARYDLEPGTWMPFVIEATVDPGGERASFVVWNDADGEPRQFNGRYGFTKNGACRGQAEPQQKFRLKFGIYKGTEHGRQHEVHFDDMRIGRTFDSVSPWNRAL